MTDMPPEDDALELLAPAVDGPLDPAIGVETPEADALEQAAVVEGDDDYREG